jgi:hypothetical protein
MMIIIIVLYLLIFALNSEDQAKLAARKYARIVQKLGFAVSVCVFHYLMVQVHASHISQHSRQ